MCVCLSVPHEISGMERRITTLLSPAQRDPPGELHELLFEPIWHVVREEKCLELFNRLHVGGRTRTLYFLVTLGRMNLAHRWNAIGTFSKVTGTTVDIAFYVNGKLITQLKNQPVCERVTTSIQLFIDESAVILTQSLGSYHSNCFFLYRFLISK